MSVRVTADQISEELEQQILDTVCVEKVEGGANAFARPRFAAQAKTYVRPYRMQDNEALFLPLVWATDNVPNVVRPSRSAFTAITPTFNTTLRAVQREIKDECISQLNRKGCVLISLYPGAGKTCLSIFLASRIGLKTLIVCHRLVLIEQWQAAINRFIDNPRIGFVKSGLSEARLRAQLNNDFLLVNAQNVKKIGWEALRDVGLVIVDEIHAIMAESLSESLSYLTPRYLIGLSATPHRPDGLDKLLDFYFGDAGHRIIRELSHPHDVYQINTAITYEEDSKTQWSALISSQCLNEARNRLIVDIILHPLFKHRHFLVLCKRVEQARWIAEHITEREEKETVSVMTEDTNHFDEHARIIVASIQKCGVGFSHDILDALVMASDVEEYFIQYLARVMRTEEVKPIVFDIVDNHPTLKRHFRTRKAVYEHAGGSIRNFWKEFPGQFEAI
jgi:superfamily II DNA or RNA helicase